MRVGDQSPGFTLKTFRLNCQARSAKKTKIQTNCHGAVCGASFQLARQPLPQVSNLSRGPARVAVSDLPGCWPEFQSTRRIVIPTAHSDRGPSDRGHSWVFHCRIAHFRHGAPPIPALLAPSDHRKSATVFDLRQTCENQPFSHDFC